MGKLVSALALFTVGVVAMVVASGCVEHPKHGDWSDNTVAFEGFVGQYSYDAKAYVYDYVDSEWDVAYQVDPTTFSQYVSGLTGWKWYADHAVLLSNGHYECASAGADPTAKYTTRSVNGTNELAMYTYDAGLNFIECWSGPGNQNWGDFAVECTSDNRPVINVHINNVGSCSCEEITPSAYNCFVACGEAYITADKATCTNVYDGEYFPEGYNRKLCSAGLSGHPERCWMRRQIDCPSPPCQVFPPGPPYVRPQL